MGKGGKAGVWYRRRRQRKAACIGITVVLVIVLIVLVVLYLAIYRPKDPRLQVPTMQLLSLYPVGYVYPLSLTNANLTLNLLVSIYNPNRATFIIEAGGMACLYYNGAQVGFTAIAPGSVPAQSSSTIAVPVTVQGSAPLQGTYLLNDVADGILQVQTTVTIVGKATTLNLFTQHSDVVSKCTVSVSFISRGIVSYTCQKSFSMDP